MRRVLTMTNRAAEGRQKISGNSGRNAGFVLSGNGRGRREKFPKKGGAEIRLMAWVFLLAGVLASLGVFYLYQVNDSATKGFEIKKLESGITSLENENKNLKIKETELRSMSNIEKNIGELNLVSSYKINYVETGGPMAMK